MKLIALILIVVLLSNSVTSCVFMGVYAIPIIGYIAMVADVILLAGIVVGIVGMIVGVGVGASRGAKHKSPGTSKPGGDIPDRVDPGQEESGTVELDYNPFVKTFFNSSATQTGNLIQKMQNVDEEEMSSFMESFDAIPQTKKNAALNRLKALSPAEIQGIVRYLNALPEAEFSSLLKRGL